MGAPREGGKPLIYTKVTSAFDLLRKNMKHFLIAKILYFQVHWLDEQAEQLQRQNRDKSKESKPIQPCSPP